jgi:lipopolysaccharide/colanic/teichoic acid biosynthesis glycosyltransferase
MFTIIFISLLFLVIYNHILYPLILKLIPERQNEEFKPVSKTNKDPVAMVVTAYNEDKFIEAKIKNFKNLNYKNKHLFVFNDGSKDKTFNILKKYRNDKNITIVNKAKNQGKIDSINSYIEDFSKNFKYTVFSDASSYLNENFVESMIAYFKKSNDVSVVSSAYYPHKDSKDVKYWNYQRILKSKEELMGGVLGVHGAGYMIKNSYLKKLQVNTINDDFLIPSKTLNLGGKVLYSNIPSYELENDQSNDLNYKRRIRIGAGNLQQVFRCSYLLNFVKNPLVAINFFSMKVLRTFMPFILFSIIALLPFVENKAVAQISSVILFLATIYTLTLSLIPKLQNVRILNIGYYILKSYYYSGVGGCYYIISKRIKGWYNPIYSKRVIFVKKLFDITAATILLVLSFPILLIGMIALKVENFNAPIFFKQQRVGIIKNGNTHLFEVIKLRTMIVDAEKETGAVFAQKNDARITKVGKILRKSRIDEIPQFFNVIMGDMSIVGPRPERPEIMEKLKKDFPYFYKRTENVKPGITGLAQVKVGYNQSLKDMEEKYKVDREYTTKSNESIFNTLYQDIKIMFSTIGVVLSMKGM